MWELFFVYLFLEGANRRGGGVWSLGIKGLAKWSLDRWCIKVRGYEKRVRRKRGIKVVS